MIKSYDAVNIDIKEVARYLGYGKAELDRNTLNIIDELIEKLDLRCRVCYLKMPVTVDEGLVNFGGFSAKSKDFAKFIGKNEEVFLFGATIGIEFDRLLKKEMVLSTARATVLQAIGTCAIESVCDMFCEEFSLSKRFSAGYGDLPLETQKDIFKALSLEKNIGITLTESLLMTPTKSVTAFAVADSCGKAKGCDACDKDCIYRKAEDK